MLAHRYYFSSVNACLLLVGFGVGWAGGDLRREYKSNGAFFSSLYFSISLYLSRFFALPLFLLLVSWEDVVRMPCFIVRYLYTKRGEMRIVYMSLSSTSRVGKARASSFV